MTAFIVGPFWIYAIIVAASAGFLGYLAGKADANDAIRHERELVETLTAERDSLQTRYMALLDKEATACQSKQ